MREAFHAFADRVSSAKSAWLERLGQVNRDAMWAILESVPAERMWETCKQFTLALLLTNQGRLLQEGTP